ncbi:MAG: glycosyltransferase [Cyanosarcina radialis HA8281-LM2]|jgi:GT2 family glycosyltransferase|nr:glycosyltransferase [Cyanosarcina radialis HA8281-LM2]
MKLSVVLGTYNRIDNLKKCIDSIKQQTKNLAKIYITDAGSTDGTIEYLKSMASDAVIPLFVGEKLGQAKAYNDVFRIVDTPYVCWLSDDNEIVNRGLDIAVQILEENPQIGMVGLKTRDLQGPFVDAPYIGGVSAIGILNVNQGVLRTDVLKKVGGFSETFRDYGIDPDLTAKVLFSGHDIVYTKEVAVHHYRDWGGDSDSPAYQQMMAKQKKYQELYLQKYDRYRQGGWFWKLKKTTWLFVRQGLGVQKLLNSSSPIFLHYIPRDWHNIMTGRYISIIEPTILKNKSYYLVQHCSPYLRPKSLKLEALGD